MKRKIEKNPEVVTSRQVAALHIECIPSGFLSSLGVSFLALLYEAMTHVRILYCSSRETRRVGWLALYPGR